jgi:hypothetical protein
VASFNEGNNTSPEGFRYLSRFKRIRVAVVSIGFSEKTAAASRRVFMFEEKLWVWRRFGGNK